MGEMEQMVILNNRSELSVSGVVSVDSFDDKLIIATNADGSAVAVEGEGMVIKDVSLEKNLFTVNGNIISFSYMETTAERKGMFGRLFHK